MSSRKFEWRLAKRVFIVTLSSNAQRAEGVAWKKNLHIIIFLSVIIVSTVQQSVDLDCLGHCQTDGNATYLTWFSYEEGQKQGKLPFQRSVILAKFMSGEGLNDSQGSRPHNAQSHWSTGQISIVTLITDHKLCIFSHFIWLSESVSQRLLSTYFGETHCFQGAVNSHKMWPLPQGIFQSL